MKIQLDKSEIEIAVKMYIKKEYLSQHNGYSIEGVSFSTSSLVIDGKLDVDASIEKISQSSQPSPCAPAVSQY